MNTTRQQSVPSSFLFKSKDGLLNEIRISHGKRIYILSRTPTEDELQSLEKTFADVRQNFRVAESINDFMKNNEVKAIAIGNPEQTSSEASISYRLEKLAQYAGKPLAEYVRALFPELVELERAETEGRGSWIGRVSELEYTVLPEKAPVLWIEAKEPGDTPPAFIQRHYAPWLGHGLTRADVRRLDPQLYRALTNWLQNPKHRLPEGFELPTKSETWAADPEGETPPEVREARRIVSRWDKRQARARTAER